MYLALNRARRVPSRPLVNGATAIDQLFDGFFYPAAARATAAQSSLAARFDVVELADRFEANVEIPGVAKDDIDVQIDGATVRVKAGPKAATAPTDAKPADGDAKPVEAADAPKVLHSNRVVRSWFRSFTLPAEVDDARAEAAYANGVLTLTLPKKEVAQPKKLAIR